MLWLDNKIGGLVGNINPKDIAFILASSLEINKAKKSREKAQIALDCLASHKSFEDYVLEFYFKEGSKLRCVALAGVFSDLKQLYSGRSVSADSLIYTVFNSKKINFVKDSKKEKGRRAELVAKLGIKSSLFLPIANFGVLVISKNDNKKFTEYEMTILKYFVNDVVIPSLDLAFDNEKNFAASIRDPLTGLYNHGYFKFQLDREVENAKRGNSNVSLIMIDVDFFKYYNDMHGHPKGDKVLINIANILKHNTRKGDLVARYGGEEFAILLFNTRIKDAFEKAEAIRKTIISFHFDNEELQPNGDLTVSLGLANFPLHAKEAHELLDKADKALYRSKNAGKNRVTVYGKFK